MSNRILRGWVGMCHLLNAISKIFSALIVILIRGPYSICMSFLQWVLIRWMLTPKQLPPKCWRFLKYTFHIASMHTNSIKYYQTLEIGLFMLTKFHSFGEHMCMQDTRVRAAKIKELKEHLIKIQKCIKMQLDSNSEGRGASSGLWAWANGASQGRPPPRVGRPRPGPAPHRLLQRRCMQSPKRGSRLHFAVYPLPNRPSTPI